MLVAELGERPMAWPLGHPLSLRDCVTASGASSRTHPLYPSLVCWNRPACDLGM